jgi:hypothetical protein
MGFRPTIRQAVGRAACLGAVAGAVVTVVAGAASLAVGAAGADGGPAAAAWMGVLAPFALGPATGALAGVALGRGDGVAIDDEGIRLAPERPLEHAAWREIADLRAERRRGRTYITVYFAGGGVTRLGAPYDGRLLARDPAFERKLFMLRNLWETHRSYALGNVRPR